MASYQNTVLVANREVEDALIAFLENQKRVRALASSAEETKEALELALIRFREGEDDFTGVFVLQGDLAEKQDEAAAAQGDVVLSLANVYKALGGGWEIRGAPGGQPDRSPNHPPPQMHELPGPIADPAAAAPLTPPTNEDEGPLMRLPPLP